MPEPIQIQQFTYHMIRTRKKGCKHPYCIMLPIHESIKEVVTSVSTRTTYMTASLANQIMMVKPSAARLKISRADSWELSCTNMALELQQKGPGVPATETLPWHCEAVRIHLNRCRVWGCDALFQVICLLSIS
jgi:hypothetical protein